MTPHERGLLLRFKGHVGAFKAASYDPDEVLRFNREDVASIEKLGATGYLQITDRVRNGMHPHGKFMAIVATLTPAGEAALGRLRAGERA